jgi:acetoin utilization deacetylase AcuC-like enzyme
LLAEAGESGERPGFAVALHPENFSTSKPREEIEFIGQSLPYYDSVRRALAERLPDYPTLSPASCDLEDFERVHTQNYLHNLQRLANGDAGITEPRRSAECAGLEFALPGYRYTLGAMMSAVEQMERGKLTRAYVFGLVGHHAYSDWGHGYCLLNPQAAAARFAQELGFSRVLIVDWDYHHGDGTQAIFANDPCVHCISIHSALDLYMSAVRVTEEGTTQAAARLGHQNIPVLADLYTDEFWTELGLEGSFVRAEGALRAFEDALQRVPWRADIVFIFSGYDAHVDDCGGDVQKWTTDDFAELTRNVLRRAHSWDSPVLSAHGGGYKQSVAVEAALRHIEILARGRGSRPSEPDGRRGQR